MCFRVKIIIGEAELVSIEGLVQIAIRANSDGKQSRKIDPLAQVPAPRIHFLHNKSVERPSNGTKWGFPRGNNIMSADRSLPCQASGNALHQPKLSITFIHR